MYAASIFWTRALFYLEICIYRMCPKTIKMKEFYENVAMLGVWFSV